jgi:hypothetical protein
LKLHAVAFGLLAIVCVVKSAFAAGASAEDRQGHRRPDANFRDFAVGAEPLPEAPLRSITVLMV